MIDNESYLFDWAVLLELTTRREREKLRAVQEEGGRKGAHRLRRLSVIS